MVDVSKPCWGMRMHGFKMLLCANMAVMTTAAVIMSSIKLNANAVICVGSTRS